MRINGVMAQTAYSARSAEVSPLTRFRRSLTPADRRSLWAMGSFIVLLHVAGLGILFGFVTPQHFQLGGDQPVFTVGVGVQLTTTVMGEATAVMGEATASRAWLTRNRWPSRLGT